MIYNEEHDVFLPPSPYPSWVLNTKKDNWEPPITRPTITEEQIEQKYYYEWNEEVINWDLKQRTI
jgi:hypothetical protein